MSEPAASIDTHRADFDPIALVNHPSRSALLDDLSDLMQRKAGFTLATLNLDHIVKMRSNLEFRDAYLAHSHVVADGNPIVWLARLARRKIDLVPGSELIEPLAAIAARLSVPIALLGATQETLDLAAARLQADHPGLSVVAKIAPPYGYDPIGDAASADLQRVRQSGAGICFLALGAPKQEQLAACGSVLAPNCGFVSIGAGLDFIAGHQTRAPRWVRRIKIEWLWRIASNPRRLAGRYWKCIMILPGLALQARRNRLTPVCNGTDTAKNDH